MIGTCRKCEVYLRELLNGELEAVPANKNGKKVMGEMNTSIPNSSSFNVNDSITTTTKNNNNNNNSNIDHLLKHQDCQENIQPKSRIQNLLEAIEAEGYTVKTQYAHLNRGSSTMANSSPNMTSIANKDKDQHQSQQKKKVGNFHDEESRGLFRGLLFNKVASSVGTLLQSTNILEKNGLLGSGKNLDKEKEKMNLPEKTFLVQCRQCEDYGAIGGARAYVQAPPLSLNLCFNRLSSKKEMEESLVHELIHVYDHIVAHRDLRDCQQLAYSEIRAAREAECSEYFRGDKFLCSWFRQWCVKTTAIKATSSLFPNEASKCVNQVFEKAYHDTAPFPKSEIPPSIFHHIPYLKVSIPTTYTPSSIPNRTQQEQQQPYVQSSSSSPSAAAAAVSTSKISSPSSTTR